MTPIADRIARALRSPQAKRLTDKAKEIARDPETRRKLDQLRTRLTKPRR
ncbi:MAG TPA: hypothetical protein VGL80_34695 [Pseudonocardiaceae bacterium]|jgi:hypothetical protein